MIYLTDENGVVADSLQEILQAVAKILQAKKNSFGDLSKSDQTMVALCGEAIGKMLFVNNTHDGVYMVELMKAFEDSFFDHKALWMDILVANQSKIIGAFSGGMINE